MRLGLLADIHGDVLSYYVGVPEDDALLRNCFATFPHRVFVMNGFTAVLDDKQNVLVPIGL